MMKSSGRNWTMFDVEVIRRLNNNDTDSLVRVLEINEDRLYACLVMVTVSVVWDGLDKSVEYVKALRETIKSERPDYVSHYEAVLPL
jgi:hypothetical protein